MNALDAPTATLLIALPVIDRLTRQQGAPAVAAKTAPATVGGTS